MRRHLLSIILLSFILSAASAGGVLTVSEGVNLSPDIFSVLSAAYAEESISFENAVVTDVAESGDGIYILTIKLDGNLFRLAVDGSDPDSAADSFHTLLQYSLDGIDEPSLDYIYSHSYSSVSLPEKGTRGRVYHLLSDKGKTIGTFIGDSRRYDAVVLEPFFIKDAYTALPLSKGLGIRIAASAGLIFSPSFRVSGKIELSFLPFFYPFMPMVGFTYIPDRNGNSIAAASLGFGYHLSLGAIFNSGFTLVEDGAVNASMFLLAGYNGSVNIGGGWSVQYEHAVNPYLFWFAGAGQDVLWQVDTGSIEVNQYTFNIGAGVLL